METQYPQPPGQDKRKDQYEAAAKCIIAIVILLMALALATIIWNYLKYHISPSWT
jgi:hypothetical protein